MLNPLNLISKLIKSPNQKQLDQSGKIVSKINELEPKFANFKDVDFPIKTNEFKKRIKKGETLDDLLPLDDSSKSECSLAIYSGVFKSSWRDLSTSSFNSSGLIFISMSTNWLA